MVAQPRAQAAPVARAGANGNGRGRPLLEVKGLKTQFKTQDGIVKAVDDISFYVMPGETLGVVGESGCGKSMTGLSIMRLIPSPPGNIVAGEILFDGQDVLKMSDEQVRSIRGNDIAMIFQDPMTSLNPVLTINRQISEALQLHMGMNKQQARERTVQLLKMVGIPNAEERVDQYPHQFSGGMRQRVMIAMALSCNPKLIIADEPTTALDVTIQAQILDLMRTLQTERDTGVILVTHSMGVVAGMADRIQVMYAGHIVETSSTEEIFANPRHPYTVGLLKSIPRLDATRKEKLEPIRGLPPDLIDLPDMCPFVPRCNYARDKCEQKNPPLLEVKPGHYAACWFWEEVSKDDDQDAVAAALGHPLPSDTHDFSDQTIIPGSHGVADFDNPLSPSAPPNIDTNSST
jgi:oligopeptide transport system ATP-binding protein